MWLLTITRTWPQVRSTLQTQSATKEGFEGLNQPTLIESAWEKCQAQIGFIHKRLYASLTPPRDGEHRHIKVDEFQNWSKLADIQTRSNVLSYVRKTACAFYSGNRITNDEALPLRDVCLRLTIIPLRWRTLVGIWRRTVCWKFTHVSKESATYSIYNTLLHRQYASIDLLLLQLNSTGPRVIREITPLNALSPVSRLTNIRNRGDKEPGVRRFGHEAPAKKKKNISALSAQTICNR